MNDEFNEEQKFTQWWVWLLLILFSVFLIYVFYKQIITGEPVGNNPMPDSGLLVLTVFIILLFTLFNIMELKTTINADKIEINFYPFVKKTIKWTEVKKAEVIQYGFVGGWGIRLWTKYGTVYNVKGNKGLAIELKNGKKYLIGTQKENEMKEIVEKTGLDHTQ